MNWLRFRSFAFSTLSLGVLMLPHVVFGAGLFSTVIVPQNGVCLCAGTAPSWGCVLQLVQNLMNASVSLGIILCVMWIAYAGFSMMISGGVAEARSLAKTRLLNAVIGIAVILAAWLVVDFVMKTIYDPTTSLDGSVIGPWNNILASTGDDYCLLPNTNPTPLTSGYIAITGSGTQSSSISVGSQIGVVKGTCTDSNKACSVTVMQGEGLTEAQAKAMSCIAVTESGGHPNIGGSGTGAQGLFQITGSNWQNSAFHTGSCTVNSSRDNADCNRQAAALMLKKGGYQPWTGKCNSSKGCGKVSNGQYWNPNAVACVAKYDPT